jgi:hypothetical protein
MATGRTVKDSASDRDVNYWYRKKLFKLCRKRYGNYFLPNDDDGRALLMVLLRFGLSADEAMEAARWLTEAELRKLKRKAWSVDNLGALIHLTYAERDYAKLWLLLPDKMTWQQVRKLQRIRDRENAKKRKRRERERELEGLRIMTQTTEREVAIKVMLEMAALPKRRPPGIQPPPEINYPDGWIAVPELAKQASALRTFCRPDGRPLHGLRQIVRRTLKRLAKRGAIKMEMFGGMRGMVWLVKLPKLGDAWESAWKRHQNSMPTHPTKHESVTPIDTVTV